MSISDAAATRNNRQIIAPRRITHNRAKLYNERALPFACADGCPFRVIQCTEKASGHWLA